MTYFGQKIDALLDTASMIADHDIGALASALQATAGRPTVVVASGGSVISAAFLARCRETLFGETTTIATPMDMVIGNGELESASVWIFSAGGNNPDTSAAALAAQGRGARNLQLITRNPSGSALDVLGTGGTAHIVPVADQKDGFLATHSMVATVGALLLASDRVSDDPFGDGLASAWLEALRASTSPAMRACHSATFAELVEEDTLLIAADPRAATVAKLIETSAWEASLCSVQHTDLRNIAHGRHAWLHHRPGRVHLLALTGVESRTAWSRLDSLVPINIRRTVYDLGDCGRFRNAVGVVDALCVIEGMGAAVGIDPGKPGIGEFGRALYSDTSLLELARSLTPCVRQKRDALAVRDDPACAEADHVAADAEWRSALGSAPVGGIVLDYDGTIVATEDRFDLPRREILDELWRLHGLGVSIGVATGRGGSAGEDLREALPAAMHAEVIMGYYNGGHLAWLDVNLRDAPPPTDPAVASVKAWIDSHAGLPSDCKWKASGVQITISVEQLVDPAALEDRIAALPEVSGGALRMMRSGHSIDVVIASASKSAVIAEMERRVTPGSQILVIGDSGARGGNDCEMLSRPSGISVGSVCGRVDGSYSMFGKQIRGPKALVSILRSIRPAEDGRIRLMIDELGLDRPGQ